MTDKGKAMLSGSPDSDSFLGPNPPFDQHERDDIYRCTHSRTGVSIGFDYSTLAPSSDGEDDIYSAAGTSQTSHSSQDALERVHMAEPTQEHAVAQRFEEQHATIDSLREMLKQLLNKKKKKKRTQHTLPRQVGSKE